MFNSNILWHYEPFVGEDATGTCMYIVAGTGMNISNSFMYGAGKGVHVVSGNNTIINGCHLICDTNPYYP